MAEKGKKNKNALYELLGVERTATLAQIKTAYKKLALKWHPDKQAESEREAATEKFKEISGAYSVLQNEEKREYYDRTGRVADNDDDMRDADAFMDDLIGQFFGGGASMSGAGAFDDFDEFIQVLEGGSDKTFRKMFRELGKSARVKQPRMNSRKAALTKKGGKRQSGKQMEKEMFEMMMGGGGLGGVEFDISHSASGNKTKFKKKKHGAADYDSEEEMEMAGMMDEMLMMQMMMGGGMPGMPGMPGGMGKNKGRRKGKMSDLDEMDDQLMQELFGDGSSFGGKASKNGKKKGAGMSAEEEMLSAMMAEMMGGGAPPMSTKPKSKAKAKKAKEEAKEQDKGGQDDKDWETDSDDDGDEEVSAKNGGEPIPEVVVADGDAPAKDDGDWETDSDDD